MGRVFHPKGGGGRDNRGGGWGGLGRERGEHRKKPPELSKAKQCIAGEEGGEKELGAKDTIRGTKY